MIKLPTTIVIGIDTKSALLLVMGLVVLALYTHQAYGLLLDLLKLTKSIHWSLVQAPLESAMNSAKAALDGRPGE